MADSFQDRTLCNGSLPLPRSSFFTPALRSRAGARPPARPPGRLQQASLGRARGPLPLIGPLLHTATSSACSRTRKKPGSLPYL